MEAALIPFLIESIILSLISFTQLFFSLRQIIYDVTHAQSWRALIVSHYATCVAIFLVCILNIDSSGGLGLYTLASIRFLIDVSSCLLVTSAGALAASFLAGYKIMVNMQHASSVTDTICTSKIVVFFTAVFWGAGLTLFTALALTRDTTLAAVSRGYVTIYMLVVGSQIVYSTVRVRSVLIHEQNRTQGKYAEAIRRLTRLLVLAIIVLIVGTYSNIASLVANIQEIAIESQLPRTPPSTYAPVNVLSDFTNAIAPGVLLMGAWKVGAGPGGGGGGRVKNIDKPRKSATPSTTEAKKVESSLRENDNSSSSPQSQSPRQKASSAPPTPTTLITIVVPPEPP